MQLPQMPAEAASACLSSGLRQPPNGSRAEQVVDSILRIAQLLRKSLDERFAKLGLNDVRYMVLQSISRSAPAGCSQSELAARIELSESNISGLVERMRIGGDVYRLRSKHDRRKRVLLLTEQGQQTLARVDTCHLATAEHLLRQLDPFQKKLLAELLDLLVEDLPRQREIDGPDHIPMREYQSAPAPAAHVDAERDAKEDSR